MMQGNTENIKERLTDVMKEIARQWQSQHVTVIICAESNINAMQSVFGYNDGAGIGTVLYISASAETIDNLLATTWSSFQKSEL